MTELQPPNVAPPREPEIEFLAKVVRFALLALRFAAGTAGVVAIAFGVATITGVRAVNPYVPASPNDGSISGPVTATAPDVVWLCIGIPLVLPIAFTFGRGRWPLLALGALLWFGPMALDGDHPWGWLIRVFASLVACSVLFVWKTLWSLTQRTIAPPAAR